MKIDLSKLKVGDSVMFRRGTCRVVSEIEYRKYDFFAYCITVLHDDSEYGYINYQFYNSYQFDGLCTVHRGDDPGDIVEIIPQETIEIEDLTDLRELNILMKKEEKMEPVKFEVGKKYKHAYGTIYEFVADLTGKVGDPFVFLHLENKLLCTFNIESVVNFLEYKELVKISGWVNVYEDGFIGSVYRTKELALKNQTGGTVAIIYVSGTEGIEK